MRDISNIGAAARACFAAFRDALDQRALQDPELESFVEAMGCEDLIRVQRGPFPRCPHHSMQKLDALLRSGSDDSLTRAVQNAAGHLDWSPLYDGVDLGGVSGSTGQRVEDMLAAQMVGSYGCFMGDRIAAGILVAPPGTHYPLHSHEAKEVYWCVAGRVDVAYGVDGQTRRLAAGDHAVTPPLCLHALHTQESPALVLYVWEGDIRAPTWWWVKEDSGQWSRTAWRRLPGEPWRIEHREQVGPNIPMGPPSSTHTYLKSPMQKERSSKLQQTNAQTSQSSREYGDKTPH